MTAKRVTRRDLRLASGLVLLTYVAGHLLNHALGLVSVQLAESALAIAVRIWQSAPGSVLLYGALAVHVALALQAVYQRRTLRMPPIELLRIVLGLGIPLLLIGHVVQTRVAWEVYGAVPRYDRIVWALWRGDGEGRQLAMLVPGWLHGCLGIYLAFGRRPLYQRLQLPLFALALLVPLLGGLGFLAMGKELAANAALHSRLDAIGVIEPAARDSLQHWREAVLAAYFGAIALVFGLREMRSLAERRDRRLFEITYPQRSVRVPRGWSVLEASRSHHLPHLSMCGGRGRCTTCRVRITAGASNCPPPAADERDALERIGAGEDIRLACQLRPTGDVGVQPLIAPDGKAEAACIAGAVERDVALLAVVWRNQAEFARRQLPQDLVFAAKSFVETACAALHAAGGAIAEARGDAVLAVFGLEGSIEQACRDSMAAARGVEQALRPVAERHAKAFGSTMDCAVIVHAGRATVAALAGGGMVVGGEALTTLRGLQAAAGEAVELVSSPTLAHAGMDAPTCPLTDFGGVQAMARFGRG
jgi:adenylate cyclase